MINFLKSRITWLALILILQSCGYHSGSDKFERIKLPEVQLAYTSTGTGFPLILIHGSLSDLLYWRNQDSVLAKNFRVIKYSRRYNYPNHNKPEANHSAIVEARDLLGLMDSLHLESAYILGHSYGAYTALLFALDNPQRVEKLVLAEPPLLRWLPGIPGSQGKFENFMENGWKPIGKAFLEEGDKAGLDATTKWWFHTPFDSIPEDLRSEMMRNAKEWKALATSSDAYPLVDTARVRSLSVPTLLISGARNAGKNNGRIDSVLSKLIPHNQRVIIEHAGHEMFIDNPEETNRAILTFLSSHQ